MERPNFINRELSLPLLAKLFEYYMIGKRGSDSKQQVAVIQPYDIIGSGRLIA